MFSPKNMKMNLWSFQAEFLTLKTEAAWLSVYYHNTARRYNTEEL
jgi:hypothetical protein